ncbi:heterokaryon incompatibility protein-domain-containing protein [Xylaria sp. FL0933]|nr:heterokaryon incompatibility protein-domain-containing protein [Xylaria sp. FL0933]
MTINNISEIGIDQFDQPRLAYDDDWDYPHEVQDKVERVLVQSSFRGEFLPESLLPKVVDEIDFERLLPGASKDLLSFVNTKAIRVFLTTLLSVSMTGSGLVEVVKNFERNELTDGCLPVEDITKRGRCLYVRRRCKKSSCAREKGKADCPHDPALDSFHTKEWSKLSFDNFFNKQWIFCAPVFKKHYLQGLKNELSRDTVLPFIWLNPEPRSGHFSKVFHAKLHVAHQDRYGSNGTDSVDVALKELRHLSGEADYNAETSWRLEVNALNEISDLKDDHLIEPIAAFKWGTAHYIMLEWADGGTLRNFWDRASEAHLYLNRQRIKEFLNQLCGLTGALSKLHGTNLQTATGLAEKAMEGSAAANSNPRPLNSKSVDAAIELQSDTFKTDAGPDVPADTDDRPLITFSNEDTESDTKHWRHGDIKPENILVFEDSTWLGTLKIADLGLAKQHHVATEFRHEVTTTKHSTLQYEAPEAVTHTQEPRSRRYDVWSMGCIILESIIWLLYGSKVLSQFYHENTHFKDHTRQTLYFTTKRRSIDGSYELVASVSDIAMHWIREILDKDPECKRYTALRQLLELVKDRLLVVPIPSKTRPKESKYRATSRELHREVEIIRRTANQDDKYLFTGVDRKQVGVPSPYSTRNRSHPHSLAVRPQGHLGVNNSLMVGMSQQALLDDRWEISDDKIISSRIIESKEFDTLKMFPRVDIATCERCLSTEFRRLGMIARNESRCLESRAKLCQLCKLILQTFNASMTGTTEIWRVNGGLAEHNFGTPILSLYKTPSANSGSIMNSDTEVQSIPTGFPKLADISSPTYFEILKKWLEDCDDNHPGCHLQSTDTSLIRVPTRLIDVGEKDSPIVHLLETRQSQSNQIQDLRYFALSHPWGDKAEHNHYCTTRENLGHHKDGINTDILPGTFRDAIQVTRELGVRYLWIDSLCIVQGEDGDFDEEASHMETVFSTAYCVLAATRARGSSSGFLTPRPERKLVKLERPGECPIYVCESIDNFQRDVIEGPLNKRGWVFQERALARRTIYFAENQNYWECGEGVRCETMTRMRNNQAALLGDPKFPKVATNSSKGGRIRLYEHLYEQYSRLQFTKISDRPLAIAGLEQRLIRAFDTQGGYGVFTRYFGRGLLWQRDVALAPQGLKPIQFPKSQKYKVPSWSWMAYEGAITFMELPFGEIEWEEKEVRSPWNHQVPALTALSPPNHSSNQTWYTTNTKERTDLTVIARDFSASADTHIIYDRGERLINQVVKCVIVGRRRVKAEINDSQTHYALIIAQRGAGGHNTQYERIGVGTLPQSAITLEGAGLLAQVF